MTWPVGVLGDEVGCAAPVDGLEFDDSEVAVGER
jgi:hypothetical protein